MSSFYNDVTQLLTVTICEKLLITVTNYFFKVTCQKLATRRSAQTHPLLTLRRCRSSLWRRRRPDCPAGSGVRVWSTSCPSPHYSSPSVWWGRAESRPGYKPHCPRTQTRRPGASRRGSECPSNCNPEKSFHADLDYKVNHIYLLFYFMIWLVILFIVLFFE